MRPFIVWFGENVPLFNESIDLVVQADIFVIIGTSLQVYPAAHLMHHCKPGTAMYYIDANPSVIPPEFIHIKANATEGVARLLDVL
jgi:NAD-dependent deacetylase